MILSFASPVLVVVLATVSISATPISAAAAMVQNETAADPPVAPDALPPTADKPVVDAKKATTDTPPADPKAKKKRSAVLVSLLAVAVIGISLATRAKAAKS